MTLLVTGAGGLIGGAVLAEAGGDAIGLVHADLDIADADAVQAALRRHRPSAVLNCAALAKVDQADHEPLLNQRANVDGPRILAEACQSAGLRLLHLGTDYVLTGPDGLDRLPVDLPPDPRSAYARAKLLGEGAVLSRGGTVIRVQWVYDPGRPGFFTWALRRLARSEPVGLVTDQVGSPTPARWLARQLMRCAEDGPPGLYHLATTGACSAEDWILSACRILGVATGSAQRKLRADLGGAYRPARSCLDASLAAQTWGLKLPAWEPALQQALADAGDDWLSGVA